MSCPFVEMTLKQLVLHAAQDAQAEAESGGEFGVRGNGEDATGEETVEED